LGLDRCPLLDSRSYLFKRRRSIYGRI